jgi:photosystem II stability/assembly factor-like uncharacterized protein
MRAILLILILGGSSLAVTLAGCGPFSRPASWHLVTEDKMSDGLAIFSLAFTESNHGWALTPSQLLATSDGGKSWTARLESNGVEKSFYSFTFIDPTTGFIVGVQQKKQGYVPLILRTEDAGKSWREISLDVVPARDIHAAHGLQSISFSGPNVGWAVGSDIVVHTADGGKTWDVQRTDKKEYLLAVTCVSPEHAWAVGAEGLVLQTRDSGKTWNRQEIGTTNLLLRVRFFGDDGWILGGIAGKNIVFRTQDGGSTWKRQDLDVSEALFDIYLSGTQGWIVGSNGTIFQTKNRGKTWQRQDSPTTNDLTCLFFLSPHEGWAGGAKRTVLRLSD